LNSVAQTRTTTTTTSFSGDDYRNLEDGVSSTSQLVNIVRFTFLQCILVVFTTCQSVNTVITSTTERTIRQKRASQLTLPSSYVRLLLPTRALRSCTSKLLLVACAIVSGLTHALFVWLLPLSGTHFLAAFVSVNL